MSDEPQKPLASQALLDYLSATYPDVAPEPFISTEKVWFLAGQVSVVKKLKSDVRAATKKDDDEE